LNRIYIDVDGVLADFMAALLSNYNENHGTTFTPEDLYDWGCSNVFQSGQKWWEYTYTPKFWSTLDVYPWAAELIATIRATGKPYAFLTALSEVHRAGESPITARKKWLDKNFCIDESDRPSSRLIIAPRKELVVAPGDILIDDCLKNIIAVQGAGGVALTLAQPWNRDAPDRKTPEEILTFIRKSA
jgi:5'(3')-deoxyribonucleotidase